MKPPPEFEPVAQHPGWHKTATGDCQALEARALELHAQFPAPVQIVCGLLEGDGGHALYLIEDASAVALAREFKVGSHSSFASSETEKVCNELSRVFAVAAFRPYFVDAAGYKARFIDRLASKQAQRIEGILTAGLESYVCEWAGDGPLVAETLIKENGLRLWWD